MRALLLAALLLPAALDAASPRSLPRGTKLDRVITIDAQSSEVNINSHNLVMRDVTISQAGLSIKAREAEANGPELKFDDSQWEFRGAVRIRFDTGTLDAENAAVTFLGNRIVRVRATGMPAEFEQKLQSLPRPATGKAGDIDYDVPEGRVTLTQGTSFTDGRNQISTESLVYSLREQRVVSGGNAPATPNGGRIQITINPDDEAAAPAGQPKP